MLTTPDGKPGLKADYSEGMRRGGRAPEANSQPLVSRTEPNVKLTDSNLPAEVAGKKTVRRAVVRIPDAHGNRRLPPRHSLRRIRKTYG